MFAMKDTFRLYSFHGTVSFFKTSLIILQPLLVLRIIIIAWNFDKYENMIKLD